MAIAASPKFLNRYILRYFGASRSRFFRAQHSAADIQKPLPEVYTTAPSPPKEKKPGQLEQWQVEQYFDKGFLVVPKFFTHEEMTPVVNVREAEPRSVCLFKHYNEAINECVDILAEKLYNGGKIKDKCEKAGFYERLTLLEQQFKGAAVLLHKMGYLPPGFRQLWGNERLLNVVEQLIGPNIAGHPVWNIRTKTPHNEQTTVPWHQDNAYFDPSALETFMPTAWIPVIDANRINGCMQMVSGGHKPGFTGTHTCCAGGTWYVEISEEEMEKSFGLNMEKDIVTCEVPFGGMLLLNNCIPHRSLENFSDKIRWSLDLRWQDPSKPTGFYNLKKSVIMRKADDPNYKINWEEFAVVDRNMLQAQHAADSALQPVDEFDTTLSGPWMNRWDIVHHNRHTATVTTTTSYDSDRTGNKA